MRRLRLYVRTTNIDYPDVAAPDCALVGPKTGLPEE